METYVRMCKEAQKDLQHREPEMNDVVAYRYVFDGYERSGVRYFFHFIEDWQSREKSKRTYIFIVWRQAQLQEMIIKEQGWKLHPRDIMTLLYHVGAWIEKHLPPFDKPGTYSMEQLWLAVVMKEVFNKTWKDGTWKKAN
ncbi:hypothetical protein LCGC14_0720600 [marine sediment metagenome]|uniref:Uncharacterized protein n=1 Tax=marine sediment metagenome TaxID=412755 RepID=A0A0F9QCJ1_9ZZZZ